MKRNRTSLCCGCGRKLRRGEPVLSPSDTKRLCSFCVEELQCADLLTLLGCRSVLELLERHSDLVGSV